MAASPIDRVLTMAEKLSLAELGRLRRAVDELTYERVQELRLAGATWASVGSDLGISPSEAHRRYRPPQYGLSGGVYAPTTDPFGTTPMT